MTIDTKVIKAARLELEEQRIKNEHLFARRFEEVYSKVPAIREIDLKLSALMVKIINASLRSGDDNVTDKLTAERAQLIFDRRRALSAAGFDENYLDERYLCDDCSDSGYVAGVMCKCLKDIYVKQQASSLSSLLKLGNEEFVNFNLSYYDDSSATEAGFSPRKSMKIVYEACKKYAQTFSDKSTSLLFLGKPGLGKTFLSACIARVVSENGFSVVYDMARAVFAKFEAVQFSHPIDLGSAREDIKRYLECDLFILDDLGTEFMTQHTVSALYEIVNTRIITNKKTIINSNLSPEDLQGCYSEQIASRLLGEYQVFRFYGEDIRKKKMESKYAD